MAQRLSVFLSHSTSDKRFVNKIGSLLQTHGISVWVDDKDILGGRGIVAALQDAVVKCDYLLVFLSPQSVDSGWVKKEWSTKLAIDMSKREFRVIPLVIKKCEIPPFLRDIRHIDFTSNYERAVSQLLATLRVKEAPEQHRGSIREYTLDFLDDLKDEFIVFPTDHSIGIIDTLKSLPRSGKIVRLHSFRQPPIRIRSVYDHLLSVAHSADTLFSVVNHGLSESDLSHVARCIAYHELNEVVLGDIPSYTNVSWPKRQVARIYAEERLRSIDNKDRERVANEFVHMFLNQKQRSNLKLVEQWAEGRTPAFRYFRLLDKMDPIIAVWRYLNVYRDKFQDDGSDFLSCMRDFFDYDYVRNIAIDYTEDPRVAVLVGTLQNRATARRYYRDRRTIFEQEDLFGIPTQVVETLIEGRGITDDVKPPRSKTPERARPRPSRAPRRPRSRRVRRSLH
jgi:5'-deoxynucleotidase YfbR-like HD superfamily hydrolase